MGNLTAQEEVFPNRFKFTGQHDPVTQQYYLHARFYNPIIACFIQEDTYRGDGLNLYAYCTNRPTHHIDSTSHWCGKKKDVFNQLATEASNSVKDQNRISNGTAQNTILALPETTSAANQPVKPVTECPAVNEIYKEPGVWEKANESMSSFSRSYQRFVTGAEDRMVYKVNGVKSDGFKNNILIEAK